jgi:hypothetical protein
MFIFKGNQIIGHFFIRVGQSCRLQYRIYPPIFNQNLYPIFLNKASSSKLSNPGLGSFDGLKASQPLG